MKNKMIYESPALEVLKLDTTDLLSESPADEQDYNDKVELPWDNL